MAGWARVLAISSCSSKSPSEKKFTPLLGDLTTVTLLSPVENEQQELRTPIASGQQTEAAPHLHQECSTLDTLADTWQVRSEALGLACDTSP